MATETQETVVDIIAEMRFHGQQNIDAEKDKPEYGILTVEGRITQNYADRLDAAHKRETDVLKQRCAELNAEIAAKDEVIKRLNDAISEEQRRKMATAENSSAVGDAAKLREAVKELMKFTCNSCERRLCEDDAEEEGGQIVPRPCSAIIGARNALSAPPRNCDRFASAEEAWDAYDAWVESYWVQGKTEPFNEFGWLYATATEKKGGDK